MSWRVESAKPVRIANPRYGRIRSRATSRSIVSCVLLIAALASGAARAQIAWPVTNLPAQTGDYYRAYHSTNQDLSALIGTAGGPQEWDLSQAQQPDETIRRVDIVPPTDGGLGTQFPEAAHSERETDESSTVIARRYYSITNEGRLYYGFYNPIDDPARSTVVFINPTLEWPANVQYGQTWNRNVKWTDTIVGFPILLDFNADVQVDGYGTLLLPSIGSVAALRIKAVHITDTYFQGDPVPFVSQTNIVYYWLAEQLGIGAEIVTFMGHPLLPPAHTNVLLRVFETSRPLNLATPFPVAGLQITVRDGSAVLGWEVATNASSYRVESVGTLGETNLWQLTSALTNGWTELLTTTQRFYRVFGIP